MFVCLFPDVGATSVGGSGQNYSDVVFPSSDISWSERGQVMVPAEVLREGNTQGESDLGGRNRGRKEGREGGGTG